MYHNPWGLVASPFAGFFHQSPTHDEALARLQFLAEHGRRVGLLFGQPGSGKSLLLERFSHQLLRAGRPAALVGLDGLAAEELLDRLLAGFGRPRPRSATLPALWRALDDRLAEYRFQGPSPVILLDDVDRAEPAALRQVERLARTACGAGTLSVVASARPDDAARLGPTLLELAELRCDLDAWDVEDTAACIEAAIAEAGGPPRLFTAEALARLDELAAGMPRRVCQFAELALLAAAGDELRQVTSEVVDAACEGLGVVTIDSVPLIG